MNKLSIAIFLSLVGLGLTAGDALAWGRCGPCCLTYKVHCTQYNAFSPPCCMPCMKPCCFTRRLPLSHEKPCKPCKEECCETKCCETDCCENICEDSCCTDGKCSPLMQSLPSEVPPHMPPANGQPESIPAPNPQAVQAPPAWNYPMQPMVAPGMQPMPMHPMMAQGMHPQMPMYPQMPMHPMYPPMPMHPMMAQGMHPQMPMHPMMVQGMQPQMPMHPMMVQGMQPQMPMHPMMMAQYPPMHPMMAQGRQPMPYPGQPNPYPGQYPTPNQALIAPPGTIGMPPTGFPTGMPMPAQ